MIKQLPFFKLVFIIPYIISLLEWKTDDVLDWLETQGLHAFKQGFKGLSIKNR